MITPTLARIMRNMKHASEYRWNYDRNIDLFKLMDESYREVISAKTIWEVNHITDIFRGAGFKVTCVETVARHHAKDKFPSNLDDGKDEEEAAYG